MEREEIFSKVLRAGRRTYFFDVRSTKAGDYYLTLTESKKFPDIFLRDEGFIETKEAPSRSFLAGVGPLALCRRAHLARHELCWNLPLEEENDGERSCQKAPENTNLGGFNFSENRNCFSKTLVFQSFGIVKCTKQMCS